MLPLSLELPLLLSLIESIARMCAPLSKQKIAFLYAHARSYRGLVEGKMTKALGYITIGLLFGVILPVWFVFLLIIAGAVIIPYRLIKGE